MKLSVNAVSLTPNFSWVGKSSQCLCNCFNSFDVTTPALRHSILLMKLTIKDTKGNNQGELEVKFPLIEDGKGTQAVHDTVVAYQAAQRMGTACTKNVGEVAGSNRKPWRQKGTGRARAGSFQSPLWQGGGVVFGPKPRDFTKKVGRKTRQLALRKALTERLRAGDVLLVDELKLES